MPTAVRVAVILTVLAVWSLVVGAQVVAFFLDKGDLPSAALFGVPAAVFVAVSPLSRRRATSESRPEPEPPVRRPAASAEGE